MNTGVIDLLLESALLLAAVCFSLSVYVLARGVGNKLNLAYSALTGLVSVWAFSFFMVSVLGLRVFETVHLNSTLLLAPVALVFMNTFLKPEGWIFRALTYLAYAVLVLFFPLVTFGLDRYATIREISYYSPAAIVLACLYLLVSETLGGVGPRGSFTTLLKRDEVLQALKARNLWIYIGGVAVTTLCVLDRVPWLGRTVPAIGNVSLGIYFYFLKDVVLQHRLVNPRRTIGRVLANTVAALFVSLVYVLMTIWLTHNMILFTLNAILSAYVAVVILNPIQRLTLLVFERFFFKESTRIEQLTRDASKAMVGVFHEKAIAEVTDDFLQSVLGTSLISFYVLDEEAGRFRSVIKRESVPEFLPLSFPLIAYWEKSREWRPLIESDLKLETERTTFFSRAPQVQLALEALQSLRSTVAIPFTYERKVLGFMTLAIVASEPPELLDDNWSVLSLLKPFCEHTGEILRELDVYARLRERDRLAALGEMAAGLAHEIRNPLGAIKGAIQVLDPKPEDKDAPFLKIIVEEVNRLNRVVTQFLDYAKPFRSQFRTADLNQVVEEGVERFRRQNADLINVRFQKDPSLSALLCQPELLGQVLQNLLENARNASLARPNGKAPELSVSLSHVDRSGQAEVFLRVQDNGIGIAPENLDKVLIPFFTLSPKGTGLGLSICQRIAEAHGGRLEIESVLEKGTVVSLRLPWRQGEI